MATIEDIKLYAELIGYKLTDEDALEIIETSSVGETIEEAVNDYLDAYER